MKKKVLKTWVTPIIKEDSIPKITLGIGNGTGRGSGSGRGNGNGRGNS